MPDDRAVEDLVAAVASLKTELADLKSTAMVRAQTGSTGDIEPTCRTTPKAGTLFLLGQTVNRADYPVLWQWAQDEGLTTTLFGTGNGTTTFVLPNMQGRFVIGAGTLGSDTYTPGAVGGSARIQQTIAQMARHGHNDWTGMAGDHNHTLYQGIPTGSTSSGGHGGHVDAGNANHAVGTGGVHGHPPAWNYTLGAHQHGIDVRCNPVGGHDHNIPLDGGTPGAGAGAGNSMDVRGPYIVLNWMIWT